MSILMFQAGLTIENLVRVFLNTHDLCIRAKHALANPRIFAGSPEHRCSTMRQVLIDFTLTVKATTLIFISWHGSAISSTKQGKSGSINKLFGRRKRACIS